MKQIIALLFVVLLAGCGKSEALKNTASSIRPNMTKDEVKSLFKEFRIISETNEVMRLDHADKFYSSNQLSASEIVFGPKPGSWAWEGCSVYFDTNGIVIAHSYMLIQ